MRTTRIIQPEKGRRPPRAQREAQRHPENRKLRSRQGQRTSTSQPDQNEGVDKVTPAMIESVKSLVEKYSAKGLKMEKILKMYSIKDIAEMNVVQYKDCMGKLELYKKKESEESKNE